ncbi:uncharacterized protein LOC118506929 [Anopheles stephensi]|uniref:uncharacterized protein LOC118506929 n=1 Tax=Anopheles stephensi TaxID=30069 RepID=UPI001658B95E|nr:uncharacterized protein LOC118506929 [Anopheles stephensi]
MSKQDKLHSKELRRKQYLDSIQRACDFIKSCSVECENQVATRLDRLEKIWESFERVQDDIDDMDLSAEDCLTNQRIRAETEELYLYAKAKLQDMLPKESKPVAASIQSSSSRVKLLRITLPEFSGNFDEWLTFHDTFVSLIHSSKEMSPIEKFHYLRASLKGEAANLIQAITVTNANYEFAWQTIVKRYSNKIILRKKHIRALISLPKMKDTGAVPLNRLIDDFRRHVQILQQFEQPIKSFSSILIELMADKLDEESLRVWEESQADNDPSFTEMMEFLEKRVRVLETLAIEKVCERSKRKQK